MAMEKGKAGDGKRGWDVSSAGLELRSTYPARHTHKI